MKSPGVTFRFGGFQDSVDRFVIGGHNLYRYEVFTGFQQNGLLWMNTVILSGIRFDDVDIDGLVQHIDEGLRITLDTVYIDGCDASRDVVVQDRELDIFYQEGFPDLCDTSQFRAFPATAGTIKIGASNPFIDLYTRMDEVFFLGISANEYGRRQFLLM